MAKSTGSKTNGKREGRVLARPRAARFVTWKDLHAAVLAWCREEVRRQAPPDFDLAQCEASLSAQGRALTDGQARQLFDRVRAALVEAAEYLDAHADSRDPYAGILASTLRPLQPELPWLMSLGRDTNAERRLLNLDASPRTRLVLRHVDIKDTSKSARVWWGDRDPSERDLAILSLLAGFFPEALKQWQSVGSGARPTVLEVVRAEEATIRRVLDRRRSPEETSRLAMAVASSVPRKAGRRD